MKSYMYEEMAAMEKNHWWFLGRRAIVLDLLRSYAPHKGKLLDIGLGTGYNASILSDLGFDVKGVEPADEAIAFAKKIAPNVSVIQAPFPSDEVPSDTYDVAVLLDVVEHLKDDVAALTDVRRVLRTGGVALITVPAFKFLWTEHDTNAHHFRRYTKRELLHAIRAAGLEPLKVSYYNFFLFTAIVGARLLSKVLGIGAGRSDFDKSPKFLNGFFASLFGAERLLLHYLTLPFGVSLVAVIRKS